ncbi:MAG: type II toxin-antitoxin system VapC family toxin [Chloroflexi bacterium]|nr:type II toxin-antitoxin system VapC family toxin [Ardenticatenaceae bacterium]NOG35980.1 type II toxin-antitoxin system VapC family toxin [Chloroflexota bacterium]GIK55431.1 MAG: ribonuclease VapC [Chloroflexota bacterium]
MNNYLVVDASLTLRILTPHPERAFFRALFDQWRQEGLALCAPSLWTYEVTCAVTKLVRFDQIAADQGRKTVQLIQRSAIQLFEPDDLLIERAFAWTLQLQRAAAYDSFYLALAEQLKCDLWTADQRLANAANQPWVHFASPAS